MPAAASASAAAPACTPSCHNYGLNYGDVDKGHRANGFTTDGGFCEYQVNNINTLVAIPDAMSDEEATLVVTAGTAMYGLTELGGLVAGESVVVTGPGPIGLLGVAVAKALGAQPVILTGTRDNRLKIGLELGADHVVNARKENAVEAVRKLNGGKGVDYVIEDTTTTEPTTTSEEPTDVLEPDTPTEGAGPAVDEWPSEEPEIELYPPDVGAGTAVTETTLPPISEP